MNIFAELPHGIMFWMYLITALVFSVIVRFILCHFKARAVQQGEANYKDEIKGIWYDFRRIPYRTIFQALFFNRGGDLHIDDYYLPTLVGLSELFIFPILMNSHKWSYIGSWLLIKTAGQWGMWQKSRTTYNRFLFGSILSLFFSYLLYYIFFLNHATVSRFR